MKLLKMKQIFFIFLFLIFISISLADASLSLSKSRIYFNLEANEKNCQNITIASEDYKGKITIRDVWSQSKEENNINKYIYNPENLGISAEYKREIKDFNRESEIELCLTGTKNGEFRGDFIFTPESDTNIVVEVGSWLFVNVTGSETTFTDTIDESAVENSKQVEIKKKSQSGITAAAVGVVAGNWQMIIIAILVIIIFGLIIYNKNKQKKDVWKV